MKKTGIELIAEERQRQIEKHGYDAEWVASHPEYYEGKEMAFVAAMLLAEEWEEGIDPVTYPEGWEDDCIHMLGKSYKERLIIAGALIAAEIDRLNALKVNNDGK